MQKENKWNKKCIVNFKKDTKGQKKRYWPSRTNSTEQECKFKCKYTGNYVKYSSPMTKVVRWDKKEKPMLCHLNMIMSIGKKKKKIHLIKFKILLGWSEKNPSKLGMEGTSLIWLRTSKKLHKQITIFNGDTLKAFLSRWGKRHECT